MSRISSKSLQFPCLECEGGIVRNFTGAGRTYAFSQDVSVVPIPSDLVIPTCGQCGETYTNS